MTDLGFSGWLVSPTIKVNADSWEMAGVMALINRPGAYSGRVTSYINGIVTFGSVNGIDVKRRMLKERLITPEDLPEVRVFPGLS